MTIREAHQEWGRKKDNNVLYCRTKSLFEKGFEMLDLDKATSLYTLRDLQTALAYSSIKNQEDKTKAASVMFHVLRYAADRVPNQQHGITFTYTDILRYKPVAAGSPVNVNENDNENENENQNENDNENENPESITEIQPSDVNEQKENEYDRQGDNNQGILLCMASNEELLEEIRRRGWKGKFRYMVTVEL